MNGWVDEAADKLTELMGRCECTRFKHMDEPCHRQAEQHEGVVSSPALCIPCLFVCWMDEDA